MLDSGVNHFHIFYHGSNLIFRSKQATIQRVASVLTLRVCLFFFGVCTARSFCCPSVFLFLQHLNLYIPEIAGVTFALQTNGAFAQHHLAPV